MSTSVNVVIRNIIKGYEQDLQSGVDLSRVVRHATKTAKILERSPDWVSKQTAQGIHNWVESKIPC